MPFNAPICIQNEMKYMLDQTKAYQVLSQIDRQQDYLEQAKSEEVYEGTSDEEGVLTYESDSSLDIFNKSRKIIENGDKVSMANYGSYFTEVIYFSFYYLP